MICKRCKSATAIISLPSHNTGFCENCFRDFFSAQVARGIETGKLFTHEDRILVALSGGKDSLSLMLELSRQGYDVTGLHIDLGIPGSSEIVRGVIERFCGKHGFKLIVKEMAKEGLAIPLVKQRLKRPSVPPAARSNGTISTRRRLKKASPPLPPGTTSTTRSPACSATPSAGTSAICRIRARASTGKTASPAR